MEVDTNESYASPPARTHYGSKACINCARVKCKCIPRADGSICERCHRLGKTCVPSGTAKQRGPKRGAASRSARLEEKLDDLVSLLRTQQVPITPNQSDNGNIDFDLDNGAHSPSTSRISTPSIDDDHTDGPSLVEAEECLRRFREEMIIFIPYIYILPEMTSRQLRQRYPFLWLNIMSVASQSVKLRNALSLQARRSIIERVVAGGDRNFDLLFGILTFVNWVHLFPMDKQFASLVSQLAVTMIWDLGLQMLPPERPPNFPPGINAIGGSDPPSKKERTVEEKRAVLGAFVVTSILSQTLKSADAFRWSADLDTYLDDLSQNSIVPQDKILVSQVKMQLIVNQVRFSSWKTNSMEIPVSWVDVVQRQLDEIISAFNVTSSVFGSDSTLLGFYYYTMLIIREWIMIKPSTPRNEPDLRRFGVYQRCIGSIKAWLDIFFSIPLTMYANVPCSIFSQQCYVVLFLRQLTTTKDACWDPKAAREIIDPLSVVDRMIQTFEQVKASASMIDPDNGDDQALALGIKKFQTLKANWYNEMEAQDQGQDPAQQEEISGRTVLPDDVRGSFVFPMLSRWRGGVPWV